MSKIICEISGEELIKSNLLLGFDFRDVHPIFKAKKSLILTSDMLNKFQQSQSWREKQLYYLAALNTMELVEFKVPAKPEPYTLEYTFRDIWTLATWIDYARFGIRERINFPRYVVREDNQKLENISSWLSSIYDIRKLFLAKSRDEDLKKKWNEETQKIEIEFRKASIIGQAFTRPLAKWALEITDCPEENFNAWLNILQTPLKEAWCLNSQEIKEIQEFLQEELPITNDQAIAVLHQVKQLLDATRKGLSSEDEEWEEDQDNEFEPIVKIIKPKGPQFEILIQPKDLPPEPQRIDFQKLFQYVAAKAKWDLMKKASEQGSGRQYNQF